MTTNRCGNEKGLSFDFGFDKFPSSRLVSCGFVLILFFSSFGFSADEDGLTVKFGVFEATPLISPGENGKGGGVFSDVLEAVAREEGWEIDYVAGTFAECMDWGKTGEVDLIGSIMEIEEREEFLDFNESSILNIWGQVYVGVDSKISMIFDLAGKKVGVMKAGAHGANFRKLAETFNINCKIIEYNDFADIAKAINSGGLDAGVFASFHGHKYESKDKLKQTSIVFNPTRLKFATSKGKNANLLAAIDRHFRKWEADNKSVYYRILDKWFKGHSREVLPDWAVKLIYIAGFVLLIVVGFNFILRHQVKARTKDLLDSEQQLKASNQQLRANEQERESLVRSLRYKNKELQDIVYSASHDLKSPLVNLSGFSGQLNVSCERLKKLAENIDQASSQEAIIDTINNDIPESLAFIMSSVIKMKSLIDGLLRVSRIGTAEINSVDIDMNELLEDVSSAMEFQLQEHGTRFSFTDIPACKGDRELLNQIFTNLIDNAIKYRERSRELVIEVSGRVEDELAVYKVKDNGKGINKAYQKKIFEIFHRLNPTDDVDGEGLGLTIVTRILDRLGGRIWLESEAGKGSEFFVSMPRCEG